MIKERESDEVAITGPSEDAVSAAKPGSKKRKRLYVTGTKGVNRVWLERRKGTLCLAWKVVTAEGHEVRRSRACVDQSLERAKAEARAWAKALRDAPRAGRRATPVRAAGPVTVGALFAAYRARHLVSKSAAERQHQTTVLEMFERCVGADIFAIQVGASEWDRYHTLRTTSDPAPDFAVFPELKGITPDQAGPLLSHPITKPDGTTARRVWPPVLFSATLLELKRSAVAAERGGERVPQRGWRWPTPVDKRSVAREFNALRQAFRWGHQQRQADGTRWLAADVFAEIRAPDDPVREQPVMDDELYAALRGVAPQVHADLDDLLVVGHETGRRGESLTALIWGDANLVEGVLTWRRELDKRGEPTQTPISDTALTQLRARAARLPRAPEDPDPVFPVTPRAIRRPKPPTYRRTPERLAAHAAAEAIWRQRTEEALAHARRTPMEPAFARHLLERAFRALGRVRPPRFGFHTLRRKFATDLKREPIKVVAKLGGWRDVETLLRYQQVTDAEQRATLRTRRRRRPAAAPPGPDEVAA